MSIVLILREEFVCLLVLFFLVIYHSIYKSKDDNNDGKSFLKIAFYAVGHVVFDIITVITVNELSVVPQTVNKWLHVIFYCFGIMFISEFLDYVIKLTMSYRFLHQYRGVKFFPVAALIVLSFFLPVEYVEGRGTNYSYGPLVFACYGIFAVYCLTALLVALVKYKNLDKKTRLGVLPTIALLAVMVGV